MKESDQLPLFTETPAREYQSSTISTWRDSMPEVTDEEQPAAEDPLAVRDEFDRLDAQGQKTAGQIALEATGMSPRKAARKQTADASRAIVSKSFEEAETDRRRAAEEASKQRTADLNQLLRDINSTKD